MKLLLFIALFISSTVVYPQTNRTAYPPPGKVANDFRALLQRPKVPFKPSFQSIVSDSVQIEKGFIYTEETEKVPMLIYKPVTPGVKSFPVVICLHGTGGSKEDESLKALMYQLTKIGIMGVAINARYSWRTGARWCKPISAIRGSNI